MKVSDLMERDLSSLSQNTSMLDAIELLWAHRASGLPVLDDDGMVVGFLSEKDILRAMIPGYVDYMDENFALPDMIKIKKRVKLIGADAVSEHMTKDIVSFEEEDDLNAAVVAIFKKNIHRAPVVRQGMLIGTIGRDDVLRGFAQTVLDESRTV